MTAAKIRVLHGLCSFNVSHCKHMLVLHIYVAFGVYHSCLMLSISLKCVKTRVVICHVSGKADKSRSLLATGFPTFYTHDRQTVQPTIRQWERCDNELSTSSVWSQFKDILQVPQKCCGCRICFLHSHLRTVVDEEFNHIFLWTMSQITSCNVKGVVKILSLI